MRGLHASTRSLAGGRACYIRDSGREDRKSDKPVYQKWARPEGFDSLREKRLDRMRANLLEGGVGLVGGADERGGFVQDNGDRDVGKHFAEMPFVLEGMKEGAVLHFRQDFDGDAPGDVHTAKSEDFQRQVA